MADNKFRFGAIKKKIERTKKELPVILAIKTQSFFVKSFTDGGLEGEKKWAEPKRKIEGTKEYKYSKFRNKPTLVNRGVLRNRVNTSIRSKVWDLIRMVVDLPYAKRHNEGLDGMPKRSYMKDVPALRRLQRSIIEKFFNKVWQR